MCIINIGIDKRCFASADRVADVLVFVNVHVDGSDAISGAPLTASRLSGYYNRLLWQHAAVWPTHADQRTGNFIVEKERKKVL